MQKPVPFRSALYHLHEDELLGALAILGKRVGIKNQAQRDKLANALYFFQHKAVDRTAGDSLYIRTHLKDGIQKAILMDGESITEDMIRQNKMLSPTSAIISISYGKSEGYYDVEAFIPI